MRNRGNADFSIELSLMRIVLMRRSVHQAAVGQAYSGVMQPALWLRGGRD